MAVLFGSNKFTPEDVESILQLCLSRNDLELFDFETEMWNKHKSEIEGEYTTKLENSHYIVPKLSLLLSVMRKCEFEKV
jgi:hypothetical protein